LRPDARAVYAGFSDIQQADVRRRVDFLCAQPHPDDEVTFAWPEDGPDTFIFYDYAWLLTYKVVDEGAVVEIWSLAPAGWLRPAIGRAGEGG
jgi:hypothetical protein